MMQQVSSEKQRVVKRFAGCETALAKIEDGALQPMEIGSADSPKGEEGDQTQTKAGLMFLVLPVILLSLYYVAHLLSGEEVSSREARLQRSARLGEPEDPSKWIVQKEGAKMVETIIGGKAVRVTTKKMEAMQQQLSRGITTITLDNKHSACIRMLHNPSMSRIPAVRLPQLFFDHTAYWLTAADPFLAPQEHSLNIAANERLKKELVKMDGIIYPSTFGNTTVPAQVEGFVAMFPLGMLILVLLY
jgi:hypothetical protein